MIVAVATSAKVQIRPSFPGRACLARKNRRHPFTAGGVVWRESEWPWTASLRALRLLVITGFFDTPFHQEHALSSIVLLGLPLSIRFSDAEIPT